ncbi:unnamed protein product [Lymnaea stagnalis]|uniref:Uncharacterized protein n=1 Tax=Lymnaea stagnalis TaxID=6523 RepID=A0AAV2HEN7_LYMST
MGMQTSTMLIMLAACILLFGEMVSTDEIVCKGDTPIKCPVTGVCCEIDHFCHTGLCRPCIPPGMSRDELLVKCKKMTIVQLMGEFNPQCQDICQRIFTFEDLNKKQNSEINDLKQKVDEILQILKQTNSQEQIKDLVTETYKESKRIQETGKY